MTLTTTIKNDLSDVTEIGTKIDGECTSTDMSHAIAHFLKSVHHSTNLRIVSEGIDEFVKGMRDEDK